MALANTPFDESVIVLLTLGLLPGVCLFGLLLGKLRTRRLKTLLFESENYGSKSWLLVETSG